MRLLFGFKTLICVELRVEFFRDPWVLAFCDDIF